MKRLAHDLNTLTRVYLEVASLREYVQFDMSAETEIDCARQTAKVIILGEVLNMINEMVDENYQDFDENGFDKFEQEKLLAREEAAEIISGELEEYYLTEWPHDFDPDFAF